ncbi:MAG TPA: hypothetical protein QGF58_08095 [Myxococcota bacterium]|nr:hypothetical protein [Myxococcota bacterium]
MHIAMLGPDLRARGAAAHLAASCADAARERGHRVDYVPTCSEGTLARQVGWIGRSQLDFLRRLSGGWKPQLFHVHIADVGSLYRKLVYLEQLEVLGVPALVHLTGPDAMEVLGTTALRRAALRRVFRLADAVCAGCVAPRDLEAIWAEVLA